MSWTRGNVRLIEALHHRVQPQDLVFPVAHAPRWESRRRRRSNSKTANGAKELTNVPPELPT